MSRFLLRSDSLIRPALAALALTAGPALAEPVARLPEYIHPATVADAAGIVADGAPEPRDGGVWYPAGTHRRLVAMLAAAEPMSDARATRAWAFGYEDGRMVGVNDCDADRARRVEAEAALEAAGDTTGRLTLAALGVAVGLVAGLVIGGAL